MAGSAMWMTSGGPFGGGVADCVFLSRGRLLVVFSLFFDDNNFLRLCEGVSVSMASSAPKHTKYVSYVMVEVGRAASGRGRMALRLLLRRLLRFLLR